MIRIADLDLSYGEKIVFNKLSTTFEDGEIVGIIGPSGCGKSILLECIMKFVEPDSGEIWFNDVEITSAEIDVDKAHEKIGMVFSECNLFEHLSVIENTMAALIHVKKMNPKDAYDKAVNILGLVGMKDSLYSYPSELSGGMKQRASIARTLAMDPEVILMDEPTSRLDPMMRGEVESIIRLIASSGKSMIIVSHEMEMLRSVCSRILFLNGGKVYEEGTPDEIFDNPKREATRRFVKELKILNLSIESKDYDFLSAQTQITEFVFKNGVGNQLHRRLLSIVEELFQMVIIQTKDENRLCIAVEYNRKEKAVKIIAKFTGPVLDTDDPRYVFSWPIIEMYSSEIVSKEIHDDGFTNLVNIKIC